jgi:hypothetical protein
MSLWLFSPVLLLGTAHNIRNGFPVMAAVVFFLFLLVSVMAWRLRTR